MVICWKRFSLLNLEASALSHDLSLSTHKQSLPLKPVSCSQFTRPLSIAQVSTAIHYDLAPQYHICLSWILCNPKFSKLLESPVMKPKHMVCCPHITGRKVISPFSSIYFLILLPMRSKYFDPFLYLLEDAQVLPVTPSWWGFQNQDCLHTSTVPLIASHFYGTTFQRLFCLTLLLSISSMQRTISCHLQLLPMIFNTSINLSLPNYLSW